MKGPSPISAILSRQRLEGKLAFAFARSSLVGGLRGSPESWAALLPKGAPILRLNLHSSGGARPYHPLMEVIRERALHLSPAERESLLSSIPVHRRHSGILRDWLATGMAEREDDLFRPRPEFEFERGRLFQSLAALFERLWAEGEVTVLIEGFENAGPSLAVFMLWMIRHGCRGRVSFICCSSAGPGGGWRWPAGLRREFFLELERRDLILYRPLKLKPWRNPPRETASTCGLRDINLARAFLAYEEAPSCDFIAALSEEEASRARASLGRMLLLSGDPAAALTQLHAALEAAIRQGDPRQAARIQASIAVCHAERENADERDRWMARARATMDGLDDPELALHLDYLRCRLQYRFTADPANATLVRTVEERLERKGAEDLLLGLRSMIPYYEGVMSQRGWDEACAEARSSLARAEALDSAYLVSSLHNALGYLLQLRGRGDDAVEHFDQCIEIRRGLGAPEDLVQAYNGAGYLSFIIGRYPRALGYFAASLGILAEKAAHAESCLTLFNIAWILFFAGSFRAATGLMDSVLAAMDDLGLESLPFHSRKDLLSFAGAASFLANAKRAALERLEAARALPDDPADGLMAPLLEALIAGLAGRDDEEEAAWQRAASLAGRDGRGCLEAFVDALRGWRAARSGDQAGAASKWARARSSIAGGHDEFMSFLAHVSAGGDPKDFAPVLLPDDSIRTLSARLAASAAQEACNRRISRRIDNLAFLGELDAALASIEGEKDLLSAALSLIVRAFNLASACVLANRFDPAVLWAQPPLPAPKAAWSWGRLFGMATADGSRLLSQPEGRILAHPFRHRRENGLWAVFSPATDLQRFTEEDAETIGLALDRLDLALQLDEVRCRLREASARDRLTGLLTRAEFMKRMERERQRHERYVGGDRAGFSLVLMDMDGFRRWNEAFGQAGGDFILKASARAGLLCVRDLDGLGRWEADRFALLLPCTDAAGAAIAAGRLLAALESSGLAAELGAFLGQEVPADWRPSWSFGVAAWDVAAPSGLEALLSSAEAALRAAKAAGGGTIRCAEASIGP